MKTLEADKFYVLTPPRPGKPRFEQCRVLGPMASHREAWLTRCAWAYDAQDVADRAELLTGEQLASHYQGRFGVLSTDEHHAIS